jgi:hypothetical protein
MFQRRARASSGADAGGEAQGNVGVHPRAVGSGQEGDSQSELR